MTTPATTHPTPPTLLSNTDRTLVWGVVNTTPDSFSDGGLHLASDAAVAHGLALVADGADVVDVGGESTRPGAARVEEAEELARVLPVVSGLAAQGVVVSIDTMRASVAAAALEAGALIVNDVSGGQADPAMAPLVAATGATCVVGHWRGHSATMNDLATYDDVVAQVRAELDARLAAFVAAGAQPDQLVADPGLGFAKRAEHDWALLAALPELVAAWGRVLVGASRKRFLGALLDGRPADERDDATTAVTALAAAAGAWGVRVHAVRGSADAVRVAARWGATA
ncbi:dihydropteroate synthase [Quadrisphaera granulorum]|uniref:Dihydropteroate synthase n=1 Tax=Quadrisphaera granulorum TaxID=317664 RepID=A0A316A8X7_9ACTN|nr:dihydropteroate synthase [Quadrisphaera granulorum]PWJ53304.1 dihydropteroate synthase [Quadrisphaera granulorum]SZE96978.1 dihydropteroate synthase [Quadrisphaera granulorum]